MDVVEAVLPAPIAVHPLGIAQAIADAPAHVWHENRETVESQKLNEWHREPGKIGPLLALGTAVDIVDQGPLAGVAEDRGREIKPGRNSQAVKRGKRGILAGGEPFRFDPQDALMGMGDPLRAVLPDSVKLAG